MEWSQHRLMATVLRILEDAGRIKGATARIVVEQLRRVYHDLFLEFKVKFALKEAVDAGLVEHCAGKYRLIVPLRGRSKSTENIVVNDSNVKEMDVEQTSPEEPKSEPVVVNPEVVLEKDVVRRIKEVRYGRREKQLPPRKTRASMSLALRSLQRPLPHVRPRTRSARRLLRRSRHNMVLRPRNTSGRALSAPRNPRQQQSASANQRRRRRKSAGASKTRRRSTTRKRR